MRSRTLLLSTLLAAALLAGCTDSGDGGNELGDEQTEQALTEVAVEATDDTGVIRGVVVDSAIRPVAGVTIEVPLPGEGEPLTTTSNDLGAFGLEGLEPGSYFVKASKAGYTETQQSVQVVAGVSTPPPVKILLEVNPSTAPYVQEFAMKGFIECSVATPVVLFAACGLLDATGLSNNHFLEEYTLDAPPAHLQSEAVWQSTQALGNELQISYTCLDCGEGGTQVRYGVAAGTSPLIMVGNVTLAEELGIGNGQPVTFRVFGTDMEETDVIDDDQIHGAYNTTTGEECLRYPVLFSSCMGFGGVGAVIQQEFEAFTHAFYHYTPPEGWQFTVDGIPAPV
ncbi:MAG: carboxypeptidase-like regulatory domain-containing protein [Thermoplasmatota archaeon]